MGKKIVQHRIFDLAVTLIFISVMATLRLAFWPTASEAVGNVATPIGGILQHWQQSVPVIPSILWCVLLFIVGLGLGRQERKQEQLMAFSKTLSNLQQKARETKYKERLEKMESKTMTMLVSTGICVMIFMVISILNTFSGT